jgi:hypothetical protein
VRRRVSQVINKLEKDTGFKLRVLTQKYPNTPGYAIKVCRQPCTFSSSTLCCQYYMCVCVYILCMYVCNRLLECGGYIFASLCHAKVPEDAGPALVIGADNSPCRRLRWRHIMMRTHSDGLFCPFLLGIHLLCGLFEYASAMYVQDYWDVNDKTIVLIADRGSKGTGATTLSHLCRCRCCCRRRRRRLLCLSCSAAIIDTRCREMD